MTTSLPLTDRPAGAVLFRTPNRAIDVAGFLADAAGLARTLPQARHVANLCRDRYGFAVGLAAALLRGQISLLSGDPSAGVLARLAEQFPGAYALTDAARDEPLPLPRHRIDGCIGRQPAAAMPATIPTLAADQPAVIVLTSGTTGGPVGTRKGWGELVARSRAAGQRFRLDEADPSAVIGTVPPGHMYGLETTVLLPLHAAASVWCGPAFFPADVAASLAAMPGPSVLVTTPLHLRALMAAPLVPPPRRVISATAPLDRALAARAERDWGATVLEIFGATEFGSIASRRTTDGDDWAMYPDVTLTGSEDAPMVAASWAEPRPLSDVIARSADGRRFRLLGRIGDLVKLGGRRASLAGLSRILTGIEGVRDGAFFAPDDLERSPTGRLVAVAVAPSHSAASLTEALRTRIEPVFLPRPLVLLDALPRNALGKLPRAALLAALTERTRSGDDKRGDHG